MRRLWTIRRRPARAEEARRGCSPRTAAGATESALFIPLSACAEDDKRRRTLLLLDNTERVHLLIQTLRRITRFDLRARSRPRVESKEELESFHLCLYMRVSRKRKKRKKRPLCLCTFAKVSIRLLVGYKSIDERLLVERLERSVDDMLSAGHDGAELMVMGED